MQYNPSNFSVFFYATVGIRPTAGNSAVLIRRRDCLQRRVLVCARHNIIYTYICRRTTKWHHWPKYSALSRVINTTQAHAAALIQLCVRPVRGDCMRVYVACTRARVRVCMCMRAVRVPKRIELAGMRLAPPAHGRQSTARPTRARAINNTCVRTVYARHRYAHHPRATPCAS